MTKIRLLKPLVALAAFVLVLVAPAAAQATIAFTKGNLSQTVYTSEDNGEGVVKIGAGTSPHVSPDGASVVYYVQGKGTKTKMMIAAADGSSGAGRVLMANWREPFELAFSANAEFVLAERGGELGPRKLVLITVATGAQKVIDSGYFGGFSFDPEGKEIVYAKAKTESFPAKSNIYRVPAAGGPRAVLSADHASVDPLWGPTGKIVFVKFIEAGKRRYGPKNELFLMKPNGKGVKRLTHTKVDQLQQGLVPMAWSGNGKRILAQFGGQDTSYAVGVNAVTGAQKPIVEATEAGLVGTAISFDGSTVFGAEGGPEPGPNHNVVAVPFGGGKAEVLVKNAFLPSFGG